MHLCISLWSVLGLQMLEPGMVRGDLATPGTLRDQDQILQGKTKQRGGEPADKETDRLSINLDPDSTLTAKQKKNPQQKTGNFSTDWIFDGVEELLFILFKYDNGVLVLLNEKESCLETRTPPSG